MRGVHCLILVACISILLGGCAQFGEVAPSPAATVAIQPLDRFMLEGRIAVRTPEQAFSGKLRWSHAPQADELLFSSPLGQGVAEVHRHNDRIWLSDAAGRRYTEDDARVWLRQTLGLDFPLANMACWVVAQPCQGSGEVLSHDEAGRVTVLQADGWQIGYDRYRAEAGTWLPGRILARHGEDLDLRLAVDQWAVP